MVSNPGVCLQYIHKITAPLHFYVAKVQMGENIWTQGRTKPSAVPWVNLLLKVQHGDGDNSEYALCSGK